MGRSGGERSGHFPAGRGDAGGRALDTAAVDLMTRHLCIVIEELGARSETFIRRHVRDLLPGRTVTIGGALSAGNARDWDAAGPVLEFRQLSPASLERWLRSYGVTVMLVEYLDVALGWIDLARRLGITLYAHAHGYDVSERLRDPDMQRAYLRFADTGGVVTMSERSRTTLSGTGLPADKVHVIPYGVDVPAVYRERPATDTVRVLAVGRMVPKKSPLSAVKAFAAASELRPKLRLDFIGGGPELRPVAQFVERHPPVAGTIVLHGAQPNAVVQQAMCAAEIFIQHSLSDPETGDEEGLPVAILEAMAAGLPVVATRHSGIPEAVEDGVTGYLVDEGDTAAMADRIVRLARDPERRTTMGRAGWARARDRFSWARERDALLRTLRQSDGSPAA